MSLPHCQKGGYARSFFDAGKNGDGSSFPRDVYAYGIMITDMICENQDMNKAPPEFAYPTDEKFEGLVSISKDCTQANPANRLSFMDILDRLGKEECLKAMGLDRAEFRRYKLEMSVPRDEMIERAKELEESGGRMRLL